MRVEIDNTTEQLLNELQKKVNNTISSLKTGQENLKSIIEDMNSSVSDAVFESTGDMNNKVIEIDKKNKKISQQIVGISEKLNELKKTIESSQKELLNKDNGKLDGLLEKVNEGNDKLGDLTVGFQNSEKMLQELDQKVMGNSEVAIKEQQLIIEKIEKSMNLLENNASIYEKNTQLIEKKSDEIKNIIHNDQTQTELSNYYKDLKSDIAQIKGLINEKMVIVISEKITLLEDKTEEYNQLLSEFQEQEQGNMLNLMDMLKMIEGVELYNRRMLDNISNYLKLPGYKRFFRGMEELKDETE